MFHQNPIFSLDGAYMLARWIHYMAGIVWLGHLYYFNFTQGAFFAATDAGTKATATRQLLPIALWWFRWGAALTFFSGLYMLAQRGHEAGFAIYQTSWGVWILLGAALATLMAYNVWFIIWPAQQIVIASANAVAGGGSANPAAAVAGGRALLASRTNVLFSLPMLFFMGAASHLPLDLSALTSFIPLVVTLAVIIGALEVNAMIGKLGPLKTVKGVVHCGLALAVVLYLVVIALV